MRLLTSCMGYLSHDEVTHLMYEVCHVMRLLTSCMRYLSCDEVTHLMFEVCHVMRLLTSCMRYLSRDESDVGNSWTELDVESTNCWMHSVSPASLSRAAAALSFNTVKRRHYHQQKSHKQSCQRGLYSLSGMTFVSVKPIVPFNFPGDITCGKGPNNCI